MFNVISFLRDRSHEIVEWKTAQPANLTDTYRFSLEEYLVATIQLNVSIDGKTDSTHSTGLRTVYLVCSI
jgi:hypothetical protein